MEGLCCRSLRKEPDTVGELCGQGSEPGETRLTCHGLWPLIEPGSQPLEVNRRGSGQMLQMRLGQTTIASAAQPKAPYPLRNRPFYTSTFSIQLPTSLRPLQLTCHQQ